MAGTHGSPKRTERFLFRGSALAVGGILNDQRAAVGEDFPPPVGSKSDLFKVVAQSSVALPIVGGKAVAESVGLISSRYVQCARSKSTVEGYFEAPGGDAFNVLTRGVTHAVTSVETSVKTVKLLSDDRRGNPKLTVEVDEIKVRMTSRHPIVPGPGVAPGDLEPELEVHLPTITNLVVHDDVGAKAVFGVEYINPLSDLNRFSAVDANLKPDKPFLEAHGGGFYPNLRVETLPKAAGGEGSPAPVAGRPVAAAFKLKNRMYCSIVKRIVHVSGPQLAQLEGVDIDLEKYPNIIHIDGLGDIFLGEMVLSPVDRRLTMMRVEFRSPPTGSVAFGGININGSTWPPAP